MAEQRKDRETCKQKHNSYQSKNGNSKTEKEDAHIRSTAPYNFIPFEEFCITPYEELPYHDSYRYDTRNGKAIPRYTGKITYELETLTELFVGGDKKNEEGELLFFQDSENYIIPGSSIRGLVRSNAAILSFARPEFIEDQRFMYRSFADKSKTIRNQYMNVMRCMNAQGDRQSFNKAVKAGYFYWATKDRLCCIPAPEFGNSGRNYEKVHEMDLYRNKILSESNQYMYSTKIMKYGEFLNKMGNGLKQEQKKEYLKRYQQEISTSYNKAYEPYGNDPFHGVRVTFNYRNNKVCDLNQGVYDGILLNSEYINGKTAHYLVKYCEEKVLKSRTDALEIDGELVRNFEQDLKRNQIQNAKLKQGFYNLPYNENGKKLVGIEHAKLFFYGQNEKGKIFGFGATPYFRVFHEHTVLEGIYGDKQGNKKYDYVQALFGFAEDGASTSNKHYEGRVSFGNCKMKKHANRLSVVRKLILAGPKPTAVQMYLEQRDKKVEELNTYSACTKTREFRIRGRKFYWKRSVPSIQVEHGQLYQRNEVEKKEKSIIPDFKKKLLQIEDKKELDSGENKTLCLHCGIKKETMKPIERETLCTLNKKVRADIKISPKGENDKIKTKCIPVLPCQTFHGEIYFENLSFDELGLLLFAIKKNKKCCDNIGSGKPYGFGKVRFQNIKVYCEDKVQSFLSTKPQMVRIPNIINEAKNAFVAAMDEKLKSQYNEKDTIKLYNNVKQQTGVSEDTMIDYMDLAYYKKRYPLEDAFEFFSLDRKANAMSADVNEENTEPAKQDSLEALLNMYGNRNEKKNSRKKKR